VFVIANGIRAGRFKRTFHDHSLHKPGEGHDIEDVELKDGTAEHLAQNADSANQPDEEIRAATE
jgi:hypothetical protein